MHSILVCRRGLAFILVGLAAHILHAAPPATFKVSEFTFTRPSQWEWVEVTSSMRQAQLKVNDAKTKENAEVVFFYFGPGSGGGTKANVDRWLGQFQEPKEKINAKVDDVTVADRKVTYVQAEGTYMSGMPGGPKTAQPNAMLVGAIIESDQGNVFIRLTGPKSLAKNSTAEFKKLVESGLKK